MLSLPSGYSVVPYVFSDPQSEKRFRLSQQPTGKIVLYKLARIAERTGIDVPIPEHGRSKFSPDMLVLPLEKYFTKPSTQYDGQVLYEAVRRVSRAFFCGANKPYALGSPLPDLRKSAGAPTFKSKGDVVEDEIRRARRILRGEAPPPVTVFHRGKDDETARPVFGYPMSMTLIENMFALPYQREIMRHHNPYVGGRSYPQLGGDLNELRWKSRWVLELDYSGFDGSISPKLIQLAFGIIRESLVMTPEEEEAWNLVIRYFLTCPVLLPDGNLVKGKRHGVPSGSAFTQLIDSIVNAIAIEYAAIKTGTSTSRYFVMGDDSAIGIKGEKPSLQAWCSKIQELGITVNLKKSRLLHINDHLYFLGHFWNSFVGTRSRTETWEKILTPERPDPRYWSKDNQERDTAFIERLDAYRVDNPALFGELTLIMNVILRKKFLWDNHTYAFYGGKAFEERARWDPAVRHMKRANVCRPFATVLYFLSAVNASDRELIS